MNSKIKAVIISSVVLVLLIGALVALKLTDGGASESESSSSSEVTSRLLYEKKQEDVESVIIKTSEGEYEVTLAGEAEWTIDELKDVPLNKNILEAITNAVCTVTAQEVIEENASDLSKYGLEDPVADVIVTFKDKDKTVKELLIGNTTPTATAKTYFAIKGESTVYTVYSSAVSVLKNGKEAAVQTVLLETPETYPIIKEVTVERTDLDYRVRLDYDASLEKSTSDDSSSTATDSEEVDYTHVMAEPIKANLDSDESTPLIRGLFGLEAKTVKRAHPSDTELEAAGLNAPAMVVTTVLEDKTYSLRIGAKDTESGYYYGMLDGIDVLYLFGEDTLPWLTFNPSDITAYMITGFYIYDVESMEVITPSGKDTFEISPEEEDFVVKRNGTALSDSERFRTFYQFLLMTPSDTIWTQDPASDTPDVKLVFNMRDGKEHTLEFYNADNRQTILKFDGVTSYKCRTTYVERLLSNLAILEGTEEIVMNW